MKGPPIYIESHMVPVQAHVGALWPWLIEATTSAKQVAHPGMAMAALDDHLAHLPRQPSRLALPSGLEATTELQRSFQQLVQGLPFVGWSKDPERVWDVETIRCGSCGAALGLVRSMEASCKAVEGLLAGSCDAVSKRLV